MVTDRTPDDIANRGLNATLRANIAFAMLAVLIAIATPLMAGCVLRYGDLFGRTPSEYTRGEWIDVLAVALGLVAASLTAFVLRSSWAGKQVSARKRFWIGLANATLMWPAFLAVALIIPFVESVVIRDCVGWLVGL